MDKLKILDEAKDFLVIAKPCGMLVHPTSTASNASNSATVVFELKDKMNKDFYKSFLHKGKDFRPGIVHRLDKTTSGVMIVARNQKGYEYFIDQFKNKLVEKTYYALVKGKLQYKEGIIDSPIGRKLQDRKKMDVVGDGTGKPAVTQYKVLQEFSLWEGSYASFVEIHPKTGRTHQIRVHMSAIGHHVIGDKVYGIGSFNSKFEKEYGLERIFLHAYRIAFVNPETDKKVSYKVDLPKELKEILDKLKKI